MFFNCRSRKENLARAIEHESNGNSSAAYECYQKAVDISPSIACELIQVRMKKTFKRMLFGMTKNISSSNADLLKCFVFLSAKECVFFSVDVITFERC